MCIIETERLLLRAWKEEDILPFYEMGRDTKVMEHFPELWDRRLVEAFIRAMRAQLKEKKYTLWATEEKSSSQFIGFIGLNTPLWQAHFTPCVEIGWRLAYKFWHKGYATEGAQEVLKYAFEQLKLPEVVAFTVPANIRSQKVM